MSKEEALKKELEKMGIHDIKDLREAVRSTTLNISLMAAVPGKAVSYGSLCG